MLNLPIKLFLIITFFLGLSSHLIDKIQNIFVNVSYGEGRKLKVNPLEGLFAHR